MAKLLARSLAIAFSVFWMLFVLLEYWVTHSHYRDAMQIFSYGLLTFKLIAIGAVGIGAILYGRRRSDLKWLNGLVVVGIALVLMVTVTDDFYELYYGRSLAAAEKFRQIITVLGAVIPVYLILAASYVLGTWALSVRRFSLIKADSKILAIGIGICMLTIFLFAAGMVHVLYNFVLIPALLIVLGVGWKHSLAFFKSTLLRPLPAIHSFGPLGLISVYVVIVVVSMNLITVVRPLPLGFDAMTLYLKLSSLIHDYHGLVQGNLPYYWSLFISLGYTLFDSITISITLSFSASVLCFITLYRLGRKWLSPDHAMLTVMLFATMPLINWLAYLDTKVDIGLLYFLLLIILLLLYLLTSLKGHSLTDRPLNLSSDSTMKVKGKKDSKSKRKESGESNNKSAPSGFPGNLDPAIQILALIGLLIGFSMGIKLSALLVAFPLVAVLWLVRGGEIAFASVAVLSLFLVLALGLDNQTGLRQLHQSAGIVQWALLGAGITSLVLVGLRNKKLLVSLVKQSVIIGVCITLPMLPWIVKNFAESGSLSVAGLTQGRSAKPTIQMQEVKKISTTIENSNK